MPYQPEFFFLSAITQALQAVVTTTEDHDYVIGQTVKFIIPTICGMIQLNNKIGIVQSVTSNTFTVNIDTLEFSPFSAAPASSPDQALILPIGDINGGFVYVTSTPLNRVKGSFFKS